VINGFIVANIKKEIITNKKIGATFAAPRVIVV
jgi:hypothetical protein